MRIHLSLLLISGTLVFAFPVSQRSMAAAEATAEQRLDEIQDNTDRWIELERRRAAEENDWESDREILASRLAALQEEQESLRRNIESFGVANQLFESNRIKLEEELNRHHEADENLARRLTVFEDRIRSLRSLLPEPLLAELAPLMRGLDISAQAEEEERSVADRAQALTALLAAISKFGNSINLTHTIRASTNGGPEKDIRVLYWGLSFAFASDAAGTEAWILRPSPGGWVWEDRPDQAPRFKALVDIYEKQLKPELVTVPVRLGQ